MAIDPNIPLQAGAGAAAPQNPLAQFGQVVGIASAMGQNKLQGVQTETAQQKLAETRARALGGIAITALSQVPDITKGDPNDPDGVLRGQMLVKALHLGIDGAVKNGVLDQGTAQHLFEGIANTRDPKELMGRVQQFALLGIDPNMALTRVYGQGGTISNGQEVQPGVVRDPMFGGGFTPAGQGVPQFPSRSELNQRVIVGYDTKGNPIFGPVQQVTPPNLGGPAAGGPSPLGDGRLPPALRNPANAPPPVTGNVTAPGAAATAAQSATGTQGAARFSQIAEQGTRAIEQDAILGNMLTEAEQFTTGAQADRIKKFQQFTVRFAPGLARAFGADEKKLAANESFDKLAAQINDAQGAGSDARLAVMQNANPNSSLSPEGIRLIVNKMRGNTDYFKARAALAANWPDKADQAGFEQLAKNLDPRVFQLMRIPAGPQRDTFFKNMPQADRDAIKVSRDWAVNQGLFGGR